MEEIVYKPIGIFKCKEEFPYDSPRQSVLASKSIGQLTLENTYPEECLKDLLGFERIWLIYDFHHNENWKPLVRPPRFSSEKRGVFATRSPYRPNSIGMSCVKIDKIMGREIIVSEHDLLDGTPILDIKPYVSYSDSFENVKQGWIENIQKFDVNWSSSVDKKISWLEESLGKPIKQIISNQLSYEPINSKIKRVQSYENNYCFSYRTWRFLFSLEGELVTVFDLKSGYKPLDLSNDDDPYGDKQAHKKFIQLFE